MSEQLAAFGPAAWLPASVQRNLAIEQRAEDREARAAERERAERLEQRHEQALAAAHAQAITRGQDIGALALTTGDGLGRGLGDIFADVIAAAEYEDGRQTAQRRARGESEPIEIIYGEPVIRTMTPKGRYVQRLLARFRQAHPAAGVIERQQFASEAAKSWQR